MAKTKRRKTDKRGKYRIWLTGIDEELMQYLDRRAKDTGAGSVSLFIRMDQTRQMRSEDDGK